MSYCLGFANECLQSKALLLAKQYGFAINQECYPRLQLEDEGLFYLLSPKEKLGMDWNDRQWVKRAHGALDAHDYLMHLSPQNYPDVIYLDPMHPSRQKQALVKKHLQVLQTLVPPNMDVDGLIELARTKCKERLVLKWPVKGHKFKGTKGSLVGKTIRFDIF